MPEFIIRAEETDLFFLFKDYKELIRCKDCKLFYKDDADIDYHICLNSALIVDDNDFCSMAERKKK